MNVIPKVSQLSGRVWRILGCNPGHMTLQGTNLYLVGTGPSRILVDAGQDGFPEYIETLSSFLKEHKISLERIIVTHWHKDHVGALDDLKNAIFSKYQKPPPIHKFKRMEKPEHDVLPDGYTRVNLKDNEQFKTDGATLEVMFTPGHTSDHASLYLHEEKAVFSGDNILGEGTSTFEDLYDYMKSLERILEADPKIIYPGHGPVVEQPKDVIKFYLKHRREREQQILDTMKAHQKPITSMEIVSVVYTETPKQLWRAAELNVIHHLDKLIKEKRVRQNVDKYFLHDEGKL
ncbi:Beta-lactamase-like protein 2, partial [Orchesella cincta]